MVASEQGGRVNGIEVADLHGYIDAVARDPERADRHPVVVARWLGGTRAEVKTRGATAEQVEAMMSACAAGSPVADRLRRAVPVQAVFEIS